MDKQWILDKVTMLIPNTYNFDSYDKILDYVVDKTMNDVAIYTNVPIEELSGAVSYIVVDMCVTLVKSTEVLTPLEDRDDGISSVTEGDESVTFKPISESIASINAANPITKDYRGQLNHFRRLRFD
ncbi:hypothetical protein [Apilactobacillus xinyiensis]|uniref:hypothetical protein n=1 Tax=Apilactobacillus xinyiensis TaxID=2841032 RepID=UPI00200C2987|nr:hypothetical protein [Apilactobacillus xinyiensis]MCL0330607.1 hypothetical protein [Apilactobacillus xinyiensis]